jgi:hypothetical protein
LASHFKEHGALINLHANSGIAHVDCQVIKMADQIEHYVNIEDIGDHIITK